MVLPTRGEIWRAQLDPTRGHEQAGSRPVLIVSNTRFSQGPSDLVIVCPLTRRVRAIPSWIRVDPPEGGLSDRSFIICEQVRAIARERLSGQAWGVLSAPTLHQVETILRALLEL